MFTSLCEYLGSNTLYDRLTYGRSAVPTDDMNYVFRITMFSQINY